MSFLSPLFLAGALAAGLPIVLHLLKRHPETLVRFSAVHLLRNAPVEQSQRRQLREILLLVLRVTALLLLALAFARPFLGSSAAGAESGALVVAIDTSLSMSAAGQFEKARQLAKQAIDREGAGGPAAVVVFADVARVASELSGDRALARAAIDAAQPGDGAGSYRAALSVAASVLRGRPGTIVVVTDLQENGWVAGDRSVVPTSVRVEVADVGAPPPNVAVTAAGIVGDHVVATVYGTGAEMRQTQVRLSVGAGQDSSAGATPGSTASILVGGGQSTDVSFALPRGQWASVSVDDREGASADNVRYLVLDRDARPKVLVVTATGDLGREAFYVEQALVARASDGPAFEVEGAAGTAIQAWDQARLDGYLAVVLLSTRGLDHRGRTLLGEYMRGGGGVLVAVGAEVDGDVLTEALGGINITVVPPVAAGAAGGPTSSRALVPSDARHPVLQAFAGSSSLGLVKFERVTTMRADQCQLLARFTTGEAALVECEQGQGRALVLASDLDNKWNDFPRHATFLAFVHEAVRFVAGVRQSSDYRVGSVPPGLRPAPGVAPLPGRAGAAARVAAVNVDPAESMSPRLTVEQFQSVVSRIEDAETVPITAAREQEDRQHLWQYALAVMAIVLVLESVVATRTT